MFNSRLSSFLTTALLRTWAALRISLVTSIWHEAMPGSTFAGFCFSVDAERCLKKSPARNTWLSWPRGLDFSSSTMRFQTGVLLGVLCLVCTGFDYRFSCTSFFISSTSQRAWNVRIASPRKLRCDIAFQGHVLGAYVFPYLSSINA